MPLIHMAVADDDVEYVESLAKWFRENKPDRFQVSVFTSWEAFDRFLRDKAGEIDVILAGEKFAGLIPNDNVIVLGPCSQTTALPSIKKYQAAPSLCANILSIISKWDSSQAKWTGRKSSLIVCFSPYLQLKSTLAICLAKISSDYIYINFEPFPFYPLKADIYSSRDLSDVFYHIKAAKGNPAFVLESSVCTEQSGICFIPPMDNPRDFWELSGKETDNLIKALTSWGRFSKIIADIDMNTSPKTIQWFEAADRIIVPFTAGQMPQINRLKYMFSGLANVNADKIRWVLAGSYDFIDRKDCLENMHFLPWLKAFPLEWPGLSIDKSQIRQLQALL